jgi:hypothetical protein
VLPDIAPVSPTEITTVDKDSGSTVRSGSRGKAKNLIGFEYIETGGSPIKAWTRGVPIKDAARKKIENVTGWLLSISISQSSRVHWGMGATVGSVIPTIDAIIPAAAWEVDIGCVTTAVRTNIVASESPDSLGAQRPRSGRRWRGRTDSGKRNDRARRRPRRRSRPAGSGSGSCARSVEQHPKASHPRPLGQPGTLARATTFVELCLDEKERLSVMLIRARGVGNKLSTYFIKLADAADQTHPLAPLIWQTRWISAVTGYYCPQPDLSRFSRAQRVPAARHPAPYLLTDPQEF